MIQNPNFQDNSGLAKERMTEFLELMGRFESLTWKQVEYVINIGIWDVKERDRLTNLLILAQQVGLTRPCDIPHMDLAIVQAVTSTFHIAESTGGYAGLGSMVFTPELSYDSFEDFNTDLLIINFHEGNFGSVHGPPRKGKTNDACVVIEKWIDKKRIAISSIEKLQEDNSYIYVPDARSLCITIAEIVKKKKKWLFAYDEGSASGYGTLQANTLQTRYTDNLMRMIGKLGGNVLYIEQMYEKTPSVVREWATSIYYAIEPGVMRLELKSPKEFEKTFQDFPKTSLPFNTRGYSLFNMNINTELMFQKMTNVKNPMEVMLEFIESPESDPANRKSPSKTSKKKEVII